MEKPSFLFYPQTGSRIRRSHACMTYCIRILFSVFLLNSSCTEVYFEKPQPDGKKNLTSMPGKIHGLYYTTTGDSMLNIQKDHIITYFENGNEVKFSMSDNMIVRRFMGNYYINIKDKENPFWMVFLFSFKGGKLFLKYADPKERDLERFRKIVEIKGEIEDNKLESNEILLNPSKKQLKQLVKEGFFEVKDTLVKTR